MTIGNAITKMIKDNHQTQEKLGKALGIRQNAVSNTVSRGNIGILKLLDIVEFFDYDIILKPRSGDNKDERTIKITKE
jgi:predicted XRE-type DNA-binding protein